MHLVLVGVGFSLMLVGLAAGCKLAAVRQAWSTVHVIWGLAVVAAIIAQAALGGLVYRWGSIGHRRTGAVSHAHRWLGRVALLSKSAFLYISYLSCTQRPCSLKFKSCLLCTSVDQG